MAKVTVESIGKLQQRVKVRGHTMLADESPEIGGEDTAPTPHEYLLAALGNCTSMTLLVYARRKGIPLEKVTVDLEESRIDAKQCADCTTKEGTVTEIRREIHLHGPLTGEQRSRLLEIAGRCPVHRTLTSEIKVRDRLVEETADERR